MQKYPIRNIRSENPPIRSEISDIRSEISDIRSDFKILDISDWVSGKNSGFRIGYGSGFFKNFNGPDPKTRYPIQKPGDPKSSDIRKFRIGFGSLCPRSEIFGSDPIRYPTLNTPTNYINILYLLPVFNISCNMEGTN